MIKNHIDNKTGFGIYAIANLIITLAMPLFVIFVIIGAKTQYWSISTHLMPFFGFLIFIILWGQFEKIVKPAYIETTITEKEIIIKTFSPNIKNWLSFVRLPGYRKHLKELRLNRQEYNDYRLKIDRFGLRKILVLQKIDLTGIYETSEINICFLGQKKYTNLILSIDRLKGIINLN